MADKPLAKDGSTAIPKAEGNPAFRAMGLPRLRKIKLPSRNWLIFFGVVGSFTSVLLYDRYHKKRAQQRWCHLVSHLADETLPVTMMPRKITILLAAPPGDGLGVAREHFQEYIKPILVAGAVDWEIIDGRREGDVRARLAEKVRKLRKKNGEAPATMTSEEQEVSAVDTLRQQSGCQEWGGIQGDLILGRHAWKEYVRGLHEGWLGPLDPPQSAEETARDLSSLDTPPDHEAPNPSAEAKTTEDPPSDTEHLSSDQPNSQPSPDSSSSAPNPESTKEKPVKPTQKPPYITPTEYSSAPVSSTIPSELPPVIALPLPHVLGFSKTPIRLYRFLTKRYLADSTGATTASLVLASSSRPYRRSADFASAVDPDEPSPSIVIGEGAVVPAGEAWEQSAVLKNEEQEWHKSAWKANEQEETKERVWQEDMVIDSRIAKRMRTFELEEGAEARATTLLEERVKQEDGIWTRAKKWAGWADEGKKGWEMGLEVNEDD